MSPPPNFSLHSKTPLPSLISFSHNSQSLTLFIKIKISEDFQSFHLTISKNPFFWSCVLSRNLVYFIPVHGESPKSSSSPWKTRLFLNKQKVPYLVWSFKNQHLQTFSFLPTLSPPPNISPMFGIIPIKPNNLDLPLRYASRSTPFDGEVAFMTSFKDKLLVCTQSTNAQTPSICLLLNPNNFEIIKKFKIVPVYYVNYCCVNKEKGILYLAAHTLGRIHAYNLETGKLLYKANVAQPYMIFAINISHNGKLLALGVDCGIFLLIESKSGKTLRTLTTGQLALTSTAFSQDDAIVYIGSESGIIYRYSILANSIVSSVKHHSLDFINHIICYKDHYYSCGHDLTIRKTECCSDILVQTWKVSFPILHFLVFDNCICAIGESQQLLILHPKTDSFSQVLSPRDASPFIHSYRLLYHNDVLFTCTTDKRIIKWTSPSKFPAGVGRKAINSKSISGSRSIAAFHA